MVDGAKRSGEEYQPQCLSAPPTLSDIKPLRQPARRKVSKLDIFGTYHVIHPSAWKVDSASFALTEFSVGWLVTSVCCSGAKTSPKDLVLGCASCGAT